MLKPILYQIASYPIGDNYNKYNNRSGFTKKNSTGSRVFLLTAKILEPNTDD